MNQPSLSSWTGEFSDSVEESKYRTLRAPRDRFHIRVIWTLSIFFFALFGLPDYLEFGAAPSYAELLSVRLAIVVLGAAVVGLSCVSRFRRRSDGVTLLAFILISTCYAVLSELRGGVERNLPGALLLVIGIYLFSPNRFIFNLSGGLFCTASFVVASMLEQPHHHVWLEGYTYLLPANLLAVLSLVRLNVLHRREYLQGLALAREVQERTRAEQLLADAHEQSQSLLHNILPVAVVADLQRRPSQQTARHYSEASVLFADLVGFTALADSLDAAQVVDVLDHVFSHFDALAEEHRLEKIKTIGDAYMAVSGVPLPLHDHLQRALQMALAMHEGANILSDQLGRKLTLRIGLHAGPLVAGVIGRKRFAYDIWGHTVNLASRLEGIALPGETVLTEAVAQRLHGDFGRARHRKVTMKGLGEVRVRGYSSTSICIQRADDPGNSVFNSTAASRYGDVGV